MKRLVALATVAAIAFASMMMAATAAPESTNTTKSSPPPACTYKTFKPWSAGIWNIDRWRRGAPKAVTEKTAERRIQCAGRENRLAMKATWLRDKLNFFYYRKAKLAERRRRLAYLTAISPPGAATLAVIRECESGGDYGISTGNGFYGAYQFDYGTWISVGGSGLASDAPPREQDERAAELYRRSGSSPWPVCGV